MSYIVPKNPTVPLLLFKLIRTMSLKPKAPILYCRNISPLLNFASLCRISRTGRVCFIFLTILKKILKKCSIECNKKTEGKRNKMDIELMKF